jgi:hypothetical protein
MQTMHKFLINLIAIIFLFSLSGCQSAMSTSSQNTNEKYTVVPTEWPLRFKKHSFSAHCYDTIGCRVLYNNDYMVMREKDEVSRSSASIGENYRDGWSGIYLGIQNFPDPAVVTWRSKDGVAHEAKIDIAEIFKDRKILHVVSREDIPEGAVISSPDIILEVNNRTINVYMKAHIPLKAPSIPGNKYSDFKNDLMLAYSHTY